MSSTVVYGAFEDGDMTEVGSIKNSYGGAMHVWRALALKYLGSFDVFANLSRLDRLWKLSDDPRLSETERIVHVSTFDRAFVRRENILRVADALEAFVPASDNLKLQASLLRTAYRDGARVVGWQQTTVSECLWEMATEDGEDSRPFNIDSDALPGPELVPA